MANLKDPAFRRAIYERDAGVCAFCGQPVPFERMHLDHAVPRSLGGPTHEANLRIAHQRCNQAAGNRHPRHGQLPLTPPERAVIFCRISEELYAGLKAWADDEFRPLNYHVTKLLQEALTAANRWPPRDTPPVP